MRVLYATRPYEAVPGSADALHEKWKKICIRALSKRQPAMMEFARNIRGIIRDFDNLNRLDIKKPKVGIVGEILVKFSPLANNHVVELLESEGAEAVMPDLLDFLDHTFSDNVVWQAAKWLGADDIFNTAVDQLQHLAGQKPAFASLVS